VLHTLPISFSILSPEQFWVMSTDVHILLHIIPKKQFK
jgi:hypothetical protein